VTQLVKLIISYVSEARDALRKMREDQVRDASKVVQIWRDVLSNYPHKLGDEGMFNHTFIVSSFLDGQHCVNSAD